MKNHKKGNLVAIAVMAVVILAYMMGLWAEESERKNFLKVEEGLKAAMQCAKEGNSNALNLLEIAKEQAKISGRNISAEAELIEIIYLNNYIDSQLEIAERELERGRDYQYAKAVLQEVKQKALILQFKGVNIRLVNREIYRLIEKVTETKKEKIEHIL